MGKRRGRVKKSEVKIPPQKILYVIKGVELRGIEFDSKCEGEPGYVRFFWVPGHDFLYRWVLDGLGRFAKVRNTLTEKRKAKLLEAVTPVAKVG
jgi:hypothetical protein